MSLVDNFRNMSGQAQEGVKKVSLSVIQRSLRLLTGLFMGSLIALIIQELTQSGNLVVIFLSLLFMFMTYRLLRNRSVLQILVIDVICILVVNSLRMYIMMAP